MNLCYFVFEKDGKHSIRLAEREEGLDKDMPALARVTDTQIVKEGDLDWRDVTSGPLLDDLAQQVGETAFISFFGLSDPEREIMDATVNSLCSFFYRLGYADGSSS